MVDTWNCQKRYVTCDPYIASENWVTIDQEIIPEN
jgi:hypothetical protein